MNVRSQVVGLLWLLPLVMAVTSTMTSLISRTQDITIITMILTDEDCLSSPM